MTLIQLKYALAVAEFKNFTAASKSCFVTQPTLSMQVQKLEDELGVPIFDRSTHPITITKLGAQIMDRAKKVLSDVDRIADLVKEEKGLLSGLFTIGIIPTISPTLTPLFLPSYLKKYPDIKIELKELKTEDLLTSLKKGFIDIGIAATPLEDPDFIEFPLYHEPFVALANEDHPIHKTTELNPKEITKHSLLLLEEGHCFRNSILNICQNYKPLDNQLQLKSGSLETLIKLVKKNIGITIIPYLKAKELNEKDQKMIKEFTTPIPSREVSIIIHKSQLKKLFIKSIEEHIKGIIRGEILMDTQIISPRLNIRI